MFSWLSRAVIPSSRKEDEVKRMEVENDNNNNNNDNKNNNNNNNENTSVSVTSIMVRKKLGRKKKEEKKVTIVVSEEKAGGDEEGGSQPVPTNGLAVPKTSHRNKFRPRPIDIDMLLPVRFETFE